MVVEAVVA
jgi:hypothetical protein